MMDMMELEDVNTSSRWVKLLYYLWKIFTCLFLHLLLIAIVIGYCFFGMFMFQNLESQYEKDTKKNITHIRQNISNHIWNYTHNLKYLHKENWTDGVRISLKDFERQLVWSMRKGGWNGNDSEDSLLWTKDGALFYSIIVITTIAIAHCGWKFCVFCYDDVENPFVFVEKSELVVEQYFSKHIPIKKKKESETGLVTRLAKTKPKICSLPNDQKLFLCKEMVKSSYFGFTFDMPLNGLKCSLYHFSFKHCTPKNCSIVRMNMYSCPPIKYLDLESDEFNLLPFATFISGTNKRNEFLYYFQEDNLSPIYLKKLVQDAQLDLLHHLVNSRTVSELRLEKQRELMKFEILNSQIKTRFAEAMKIRNLRKPYIKYGYTLSSTPVCGLSRKYKIHLCRMVARKDPKWPSKVFYSGYDEVRCYKRKIFFEKPERRYLNNGYLVTMLKCPPFYEGNFGERPRFKVTTKFLSTSLTDNSVFSYVRRNSWGQNIVPDGFIYEISFEDFEQDRRRTKEFMKPHYLPEYELGLQYSMRSLSSQTSRWSLSSSSIEIIFNRDIVEDDVILLANTIGVRNPYERFRHTISKLNISSWTCDDVAYLCRQVLLHQSYNFKMNNHPYKPSKKDCSSKPIPVKLALRDAEWLPRKKMWARKCPPVTAYAFQYYVFGGMKPNTVVFYARYGYQGFAFPDSVVIRVNEIFEEDYIELKGDDSAVAELEEDTNE